MGVVEATAGRRLTAFGKGVPVLASDATRQRISLAMLAITAMCIVPSAAMAAPRSTAKLRHTFGELVLALRATGNAAVCSHASPSGRLALIQMWRGEERFLPSTTCIQAFAEPVEGSIGITRLCDESPILIQTIIERAIIHEKGNRATIQLDVDQTCGGGPQPLTGAAALSRDPLGTTHWIRQHGRWLFDDKPTGTYSPTGRKVAAMLRAALDGRNITTEALPGGFFLSVPFCADGATTPILTTPKETEPLGPTLWYVAGGVTATDTQETPLDAHGDPQGAVFVPSSLREEWNVTLLEGVPHLTDASGVSVPIGAPDTAGC